VSERDIQAATQEATASTRLPLRHIRDAFDRSVALILGVNAYRRGLRCLKTAVPDATSIGALLEWHHDFIQVLRCDEDVTRDEVRSLLGRGFEDQLGSPITERDRLLVYFAGHGDSLPSEHGPDGHLLLADADPADPRTFFAMSELRTLLDELPCRHVLLVLDCCFAGTIRWAGNHRDRHANIPLYRERLERFVSNRARQVLVSASHDQTALDAMWSSSRPVADDLIESLRSDRVEVAEHSPFAAAFLDALTGSADYTKDHLIDARELALFVRDAVETATHVHQTPLLYPLDHHHDRGEFVFQVPDTTLAVEPAPALSLAACPYRGLQPFGSEEQAWFFGRDRALDALVDRVVSHPFTAVVGPSGLGKSSMLFAGLAPGLRGTDEWTVIEIPAGANLDDVLRDVLEIDAIANRGTIVERIDAWMSTRSTGHLCFIADDAEALVEDGTLADLARALEAHERRLRVVFALSHRRGWPFVSSELHRLLDAGTVALAPPTQDELREIVEGPARAIELWFEPPGLVDKLINEVLHAPAPLPLLSLVLRELYVRCAARNRDRLLTEEDYACMGNLTGVLARRATEILEELVGRDARFLETARRVFLRMVAPPGADRVRCCVRGYELRYADPDENKRVDALLAAFEQSGLVHDRRGWELAHDTLVQGWDVLSSWREEHGDEELQLQHDVADAARRWTRNEPQAHLWRGGNRAMRSLRHALQVARRRDSWLTAHELEFVKASERRRLASRVPSLILAVLVIAAFTIWDLYYCTHVNYYRGFVRRWGEPEGLDRVSWSQALHRATSVKLVRRGRLGHVTHVELVRNAYFRTRTSSEVDVNATTQNENLPCQWDFEYGLNGRPDTVSIETARNRADRIVYTIRYRGDSKERIRAHFVSRNGLDAIRRGSAELVEFVRSEDGLDVNERYLSRSGQPAQNEHGVAVVVTRHDSHGRTIAMWNLDVANRAMRVREGFASWRATFDDRGNQTVRTFYGEDGKPVRLEEGFSGWLSVFDGFGNEAARAFFDEGGKRARHRDGFSGWISTLDSRGNATTHHFIDEAGEPTRHKDGFSGWRSTFDKLGNETARDFLDEADHPARHRDGFFGWRSKFDAVGNETERIFVDEAGNTTRRSDGDTGWRLNVDERGSESKHVRLR
jgi:hypothetical protein